MVDHTDHRCPQITVIVFVNKIFLWTTYIVVITVIRNLSTYKYVRFYVQRYTSFQTQPIIVLETVISLNFI